MCSAFGVTSTGVNSSKRGMFEFELHFFAFSLETLGHRLHCAAPSLTMDQDLELGFEHRTVLGNDDSTPPPLRTAADEDAGLGGFGEFGETGAENEGGQPEVVRTEAPAGDGDVVHDDGSGSNATTPSADQRPPRIRVPLYIVIAVGTTLSSPQSHLSLLAQFLARTKVG
jgi:hypothetical protein